MVLLILRGLLLFLIMIGYSVKFFEMVNEWFSAEYSKTFNSSAEMDKIDANNVVGKFCGIDDPFRGVCYNAV